MAARVKKKVGPGKRRRRRGGSARTASPGAPRRRAATYAYCVVRSDATPSLADAPAGLPGAGALRALRVGPGLWLIVAAVPLPLYGSAAIERGLRDLEWVSARALAHERVVEHLARQGPVAPLKLFTLFVSDARALASIASRRASLTRTLARVAGQREWGVRLGLDRRRTEDAPREEVRGDVTILSAGRRYLAAKKAARDAAQRSLHDAVQRADDVYAELAGLASAARRREPVQAEAGMRLLLDATFLVPQQEEQRFLDSARQWARRLEREGCRLALTGPWPPYNFVTTP